MSESKNYGAWNQDKSMKVGTIATTKQVSPSALRYTCAKCGVFLGRHDSPPVCHCGSTRFHSGR